jgi:hypothetical protein
LKMAGFHIIDLGIQNEFDHFANVPPGIVGAGYDGVRR